MTIDEKAAVIEAALKEQYDAGTLMILEEGRGDYAGSLRVEGWIDLARLVRKMYETLAYPYRLSTVEVDSETGKSRRISY